MPRAMQLQDSPDRKGNAGANVPTECAGNTGSELAVETVVPDTRSGTVVPALEWRAGSPYLRA